MTHQGPDIRIDSSLPSGGESTTVQGADVRNHPLEPAAHRPAKVVAFIKALLNSPKETTDPTDKHRSIVKVAGLLGIVGTVLANTVAIGTHLNELRGLLVKYFGADFLLRIHGVVFWGTLVVFLIALSALAFWIYASFFSRSSRVGKVIFLIGSAIMIAGLALGMQRIIRPVELSPIIAKQSQGLVASIVLQHIDQGDALRGGFRVSQDRQSNDTQAWTTAQCLLAILTQRPEDVVASAKAVRDGFAFLESVKVNDLGWDYMVRTPPGPGVTEITAWVTLAYLESLRFDIKQKVWEDDTAAERAVAAVADNIRIILSRQFDSGGWSTISKTTNDDHIRTYSTTMAVWALAEAVRMGYLDPDLERKAITAIRNGVRYLLQSYSTSTRGVGGWWPNPNRGAQLDDFVGLTAQTLYALLRAQKAVPTLRMPMPFANALSNFINLGLNGTEKYIAFREREVSSNHRVHDADQYLEGRSDMVEGSTFLWYPWALTAAVELWKSRLLESEEKESTAILVYKLLKRSANAVDFAKSDPVIYPSAEIAVAFNVYLASSFTVESISKP